MARIHRYVLGLRRTQAPLKLLAAMGRNDQSIFIDCLQRGPSTVNAPVFKKKIYRHTFTEKIFQRQITKIGLSEAMMAVGQPALAHFD